jgi:two-component system NarL family sensor kinase
MTGLGMALLAVVAVAAISAGASALAHRRRAALLDASRKRLAALALDAETREQGRLSEVLHDTALQTLAMARQDLEDVLRGDEEARRRAVVGVETAIAQVRQVVSDLHPAVAEQLGLGPALHTLALDHAGRRGFTIRVEADRDAVGVDDAVLLFLARELLANAAAHAGATQVEVRVSRSDEHLVLRVADDGCGFDEQTRADALRNGHIGLAASQERVEALGGSFLVSSNPGAGTAVTVSLPVHRERRRIARPAVTATEPSPAAR